MIISIKVKPNSSKNLIEKRGDNNFLAYIKEAPIQGRANETLIELLSKHFGVSRNFIKIKTGSSSKIKLVELKGI